MNFKKIIVLILAPFTLLGQIDQHVLSRQNGMLDNEINWYIYQDSKSLIWISCATGVSIYDGTSYKNHEFNNPLSGLKGTSVQSPFFEDSNNNIWFTTYEHLIEYNRERNTFLSHTIYLDNQPISNGYHMYRLDTLTNLKWLKCGKSLITIEGENLKNPKIIINDTPSIRFLNLMNKDSTISVLGFPWVISPGIEINKISNNKVSEVPILQEHINSLTFRGGHQIEDKVYLFSHDGIIRYNPDNHSFSNPIKPPNWDNETPSYCKNNTSFYLNNNNIDILEFDTKTESFQSLINKYELDIQLSQLPTLNTIGQHLAYSIDGNYIMYHKLHEDLKSNFTELNSNMVDFFEDDQYKFISTTDKVFKLNNIYKPIKKYNLPKVQRIFKINENYYCYSKDEIFRYNKRMDIWQSMFKINNRFFKNVYISDDFYLSTLKGIMQFDEVDGNLIEIENEFDSLCYSNLIKIAPKEYLYILDELKICHSKNEMTTCVSNNSVITNLIFIKELNRYFVLSDNGLHTIDIQNSKIELTKISQLKNIIKIAYANRILWIVSNNSIYKYDLDKDKILGEIQLNTEINTLSPLHLTNNNSILIGTREGYHNFSIEEVTLHNKMYDINIHQIQINNTDFKTTKSYNYISNINLSYDQNNILFEPHVITINEPQKTHITYTLDGYETEWKTIDNGEEIRYSNLPYGSYELKMIPISSAYVEGHPKTITITISPPFYQSWWFLLSVASGLIGIGWLISHTLAKRKLKEIQIVLEKQQALSAQREKIADDLHDELGTELNKILYLSDEAIYEKDSHEKENLLDNIGKLASESIHNMRDILWVLDNENDTLDSLVARIK